ncbi:MAG: hypothetical protein OXD44_00495, partial [Gammaproteobacteria bacterium]|nr:hypothetical protein [Gammaproteobacteria bacterium]
SRLSPFRRLTGCLATLIPPLSVHEGVAFMDRQGEVLHFGVELGLFCSTEQLKFSLGDTI